MTIHMHAHTNSTRVKRQARIKAGEVVPVQSCIWAHLGAHDWRPLRPHYHVLGCSSQIALSCDRVTCTDEVLSFAPLLEFGSWHHFWRSLDLNLAWWYSHALLLETEELVGQVDPMKLEGTLLDGGAAYSLWDPTPSAILGDDANDDSELNELRRKIMEDTVDSDDERFDSASHDAGDDASDNTSSSSRDSANSHHSDSNKSASNFSQASSSNASVDVPARGKRIFSVTLPDYVCGGEIIVYRSGEMYAMCPIHGRRCRKSGLGIILHHRQYQTLDLRYLPRLEFY